MGSKSNWFWRIVITKKDKLEAIKRDLREANEKFIEAEKYLENLKVDLENPSVK